MKDINIIDIENCISGIEHAITDIDKELAFLQHLLDDLKIEVEINYGQGRIE